MSAVDIEGLRVKIESAEEYSEISVQLSVPWAKAILTELERERWIPPNEPPKYFEGIEDTPDIMILDDRKVVIGSYQRGQYVYWHGAWCNIDEPASQKAIRGWMPMPPLPEPKPCELCGGSGEVDQTCEECGKLRDEDCFSTCRKKPCPACRKENKDG